MNQQTKPVQRSTPTTLQEKKNIGIGLMSFPAMTVQPFIRGKTGFRLLKPGKLLILTLLMLAVGYVVPPGDSGGGDAIPSPVVMLPQSDIPAGLDAPLPANWPHLNDGTQAAWLHKHRLSQQQQHERQQREAKEREGLLAEAQAKAERAARWANFKNYLSRRAMYFFALAFLAVGLYQRRARWNGLVNGEKWHTRSRGVPHLNKVLGHLLPETWIVRFADPLAVLLTGLTALLFTRALGLWLIFCAFALYVVEQAVYERELDHVLDVFDNLIDAETVYDVVSFLKRGGKNTENTAVKSIEENGGVLSTSAMVPDALRRREERDAKALRSLERETAMLAEIDRSLADGPHDPPPAKPNGSGLAASDERL